MFAWRDVKLVWGIIRDGEKTGDGAGGRMVLQVTDCICIGGGKICCSATHLPRGGKYSVRSQTQTHHPTGCPGTAGTRLEQGWSNHAEPGDSRP